MYFRLKKFDQSAASSKIPSQSATPPISVVGIGNKGQMNHDEYHAVLLSGTKSQSRTTRRLRLWSLLYVLLERKSIRVLRVAY